MQFIGRCNDIKNGFLFCRNNWNVESMWWCDRDKAVVSGGGLINSVINNLPFEMHLPGYQFCGPGTNLEKRLARGETGINPLDSACRSHDITYSKFKEDGPERFEADKLLASAAWDRVKSFDAGLGERAAALTVTGAMKAKMGISRIGKGISKRNRRSKKKKTSKKRSRKTKSFASIVKAAKIKLRLCKGKKANCVNGIVSTALAAARECNNKSNSPIAQPRIIPIPKTGGLLPIVPAMAALSAIGALAKGVPTIINALGNINDARKKIFGNAAVPIGSGLYLKPYRKGYGLYLQPFKKNF